MDKLKGMLLSRLKERSTWVGLVSVLTALGVGLTPDQTNAIVTAGVALAGVVWALFPENGKAGKQEVVEVKVKKDDEV